MFYELLGKLTLAFLIASCFLFLTSLALGILLIKKHKLVLPNLLLFGIDTFYLYLKRFASKFGLGEKIIDLIGIEVRNSLSRDKFAEVKAEDRILVVPQCLRHEKCPARLDSTIGITCKECGMCMIKDLKTEAEKLGYRFYIVPGGRFVERIVKAVRPKAALGVACAKDLNMSMHDLSKIKCLVQGVPLIKDGCVHTEVDIKELVRVMRLGIEKRVEEIGRGCPSDGQPQTSGV
jgi:hypothetical protein